MPGIETIRYQSSPSDEIELSLELAERAMHHMLRGGELSGAKDGAGKQILGEMQCTDRSWAAPMLRTGVWLKFTAARGIASKGAQAQAMGMNWLHSRLQDHPQLSAVRHFGVVTEPDNTYAINVVEAAKGRQACSYEQRHQARDIAFHAACKLSDEIGFWNMRAVCDPNASNVFVTGLGCYTFIDQIRDPFDPRTVRRLVRMGAIAADDLPNLRVSIAERFRLWLQDNESATLCKP